MNTKLLLSSYLKKPLAIALTATLVMSSASTHAQSNTQNNNISTGTFVTSSAIVGAIAGGPIGFVVGMMGSALVKDQIDRHDIKNAEISTSEETIVSLQQNIIHQEENMAELEQLVNKKMALEILFDTGVDDPSIADIEKLRELSLFLSENESFEIELEGHTDHRGSDEYNNILSFERAKSVSSILNGYGITEEQINVRGHGSNQAKSNTDSNEMAKDRRVDIKIVFDTPKQKNTKNLVQLTPNSF